MDPLTSAMLLSTGVGASSSKKASNNAAQASAAQIALGEKGLALQASAQRLTERQYEDAHAEFERWKSIYGPLQEDLGTYFRNLTGESLSNSEVVNIQKASQDSKDKIVQSLAQSGRANSGLESYLLSQNDYSTELAKAESRSSAEQRAIQAKSNFLALGLGQGNVIRREQSNLAQLIGNQAVTQSAGYGRLGNMQVQGAALQNAIGMNFAHNLQGTISYGYRHGAFGGNTPGTATPYIGQNVAEQSYANGIGVV